jgi:phosphatidylinositol glycan class T
MFQSLFFLCFVLTLILPCTTAESDYYERLDLQPLPLGSLRASFDFRSNESLAAFEAQNFRFFPRSLGQILRHAHTKELHLRFSTGRWDAELWGARPWDGFKEGGTGVELWAWIEAATDTEAADRWSTLTQSLSGLFCASINFIDSTRTTKPTLSFSPTGDHDIGQQLYFLHGVLPGEVVCTENLTPFLKLLPCKGKTGISSLLDGHKVFDASWQSMSIDVRPVCAADSKSHIEISQTIDMVLDIPRSKRPRDNPIPRPVSNEELVCDQSKPYHSQDTCYPLDMVNSPSWSLHDVFGRPLSGSCPLTDDEGPDAQSICIEIPHSQQVLISASGWEVKSPAGHLPESRCYQIMPSEDFDMNLPERPQQPHQRLQPHGHELLHVSRTITGHGAATGGLRTTFTNPSATDPITFIYFETLPWFMRPFIHTLRATLTHSAFPFPWSASLINSIHYVPALDRQRPTSLELLISLPPASTATLTYDFEKAVLRYTEYPPDANRGFNVAPAVIRILDETNADGSRKDVYIRTTSLLLPLPTPDFSMPYNVIILTSTVMALAFGSIFNLLVRRFVGVDEVPKSALGKLRDRFMGRLVAVKDRVAGKGEKIE